MAESVKGRLNPLLVVSSLLYFVAAVPLLFAADELLAAAGVAATPLDSALLQVLAAALFGFSMLNWFQRFTLTGGIYGRPVVVANFCHTAMAALALAHFVRQFLPAGNASPVLLAAAAVYGALAVAFGWAFFRRAPGS